MSVGAPDLDRLAELEAQQRFLLRSLADLDREHAAGDVDDVDYRTLRDGYTARAATVLRAIDEGRAALPARGPRNRWAIAAWIVGVLAVAVGAGVLVARSSGQNLSDTAPRGTGPLTDDDLSALLSQARQMLGAGDNRGAFGVYSTVLQQSPDDVEANTYAAWLLVLDARQQSDAGLAAQRATQSMLLLQHARDVDPSYPDAHCFTAVIAADFLVPPDLQLGRTEGRACLDAHPPDDIRSLVEDFLASLDAASTTSVTSVTSAAGDAGASTTSTAPAG